MDFWTRYKLNSLRENFKKIIKWFWNSALAFLNNQVQTQVQCWVQIRTDLYMIPVHLVSAFFVWQTMLVIIHFLFDSKFKKAFSFYPWPRIQGWSSQRKDNVIWLYSIKDRPHSKNVPVSQNIYRSWSRDPTVEFVLDFFKT